MHPHVDGPHRSRLHARGARILAPALHGLARIRRAEAGARPARPRVPEHRASHRRGVPGRLGRVSHDIARGQRRRARSACSRRRPCLGVDVQRLHGERRPLVRRPRDGALVTRGSRTRPAGSTPLRPAGTARVRRRRSRELPRLARRHVRVRCSSRPARPMGAPHRAGAGSGDVRLHDAGDRLRAPARRNARPEGRRPRSRRRPGRNRARLRWRSSQRRRGRARARLGRTRHRGAADRRRDDPRRAGGRRRSHADSALRCSSSERETSRRRSRARPNASATAAARCRSTSR